MVSISWHKRKKNFAACTVFNSKIVAAWGVNYSQVLEPVEAYDYYENKWTYLPDMIKRRRCHASVSMGNKLFVIGGYFNTSCEVFDSFSRKFTVFNYRFVNTIGRSSCIAVCVGNKIIVFCWQWEYSGNKDFNCEICEKKFAKKVLFEK